MDCSDDTEVIVYHVSEEPNLVTPKCPKDLFHVQRTRAGMRLDTLGAGTSAADPIVPPIDRSTSDATKRGSRIGSQGLAP